MKYLVKTFSLTAGVAKDLQYTGKYFTIISASGTASNVTANAFKYGGSSPIGTIEGLEVGLVVPNLPDGFQSLQLLSTETQTVKVAISDDPITLQVIAGIASVAVSDGTALANSAASLTTTEGDLIAANSSRKALYLYSEDTNTDSVRLGATTLGTGGLVLRPGEYRQIIEGCKALWRGKAASGTQIIQIVAVT